MELYRHPFYAFIYDPQRKVITFRWTTETERMQVHDFQEALHNFAGFAFDNPARGLLIDLRDFRFQPPASLGYWRDEAVSPRYVKAGVKKLAYIAPPGLLERMKSAPDEYKDRRGFPEGYFGNEAEALGWLGS
jgi:hypothetical protein